MKNHQAPTRFPTCPTIHGSIGARLDPRYIGVKLLSSHVTNWRKGREEQEETIKKAGFGHGAGVTNPWRFPTGAPRMRKLERCVAVNFLFQPSNLSTTKQRERGASPTRHLSKAHKSTAPIPRHDLRRRSSHSALCDSTFSTFDPQSTHPDHQASPRAQQPLRAPSQSRVRWKTLSAPEAFSSERDGERDGERVDDIAGARAHSDARTRQISQTSRSALRLGDVIDLRNSKHTTVHSHWNLGPFFNLKNLMGVW